MSTGQLYNEWSTTYDAIENKTRDLERTAGQHILGSLAVDSIIELGCGTGKNTVWLSEKCNSLLAIDLSEEMMAKARQKVNKENVLFLQADITKDWSFINAKADLITCSLILEHIENLQPVFKNAADHLNEGGRFYICELHPFKQYSGSKARFETPAGTQVLECFVHHMSDFLQAASVAGLSLERLDEWFDDNDRSAVPRLVSFVFRR